MDSKPSLQIVQETVKSMLCERPASPVHSPSSRRESTLLELGARSKSCWQSTAQAPVLAQSMPSNFPSPLFPGGPPNSDSISSQCMSCPPLLHDLRRSVWFGGSPAAISHWMSQGLPAPPVPPQLRKSNVAQDLAPHKQQWPRFPPPPPSKPQPLRPSSASRPRQRSCSNVRNSELPNADIDEIPTFRLREMKMHLKDLLLMEQLKPPPLFTSVCQTETDSGNDDNFENKSDSSGASIQPTILDSNSENETECNSEDEVVSNFFPGPPSCPATILDDSPESIASSAVPRIRRKIKKAKLISPAWRAGSRAAAELLSQKKLEAAKEGDVIELILRQIRYSQESIRAIFRDGRAIMQMYQELREGRKSLASIPTITAVMHDNEVHSTDNRRLWVFKHCGITHDARIPVVVGKLDERSAKKFTTPSKGVTIRVRSNQGCI